MNLDYLYSFYMTVGLYVGLQKIFIKNDLWGNRLRYAMMPQCTVPSCMDQLMGLLAYTLAAVTEAPSVKFQYDLMIMDMIIRHF